MQSDEQEIRELFDDWIKATTVGDIELARACIADDALFVGPGPWEMDKESFAHAAAGVSPEDSPFEYDLKSELKEVKVLGSHAYMIVESSLTMTPKAEGESAKMAGHSLSVLEKRDGRWQIVRDANTLIAVQE